MPEPTEHTAINVITDRLDAIYRLADVVTFTISRADATAAPPESIPYSITWDGETPIAGGAIAASELPQRVEVRADRPGFVRIDCDLGMQEGKPVVASSSAAVSPELIAPSAPAPPDFDAFWASELRALDEVPLDPEVSLHSAQNGARIHRVRLPMPEGRDLYGWLLIPDGFGPFPAVARFHGAGVYGIPPENGVDLTARGVMVFSVNPHPIPNDWPKERYAELRTGDLADYRTRGRERRESVYFREMFLRAVRACAFLASRPEWNGKHLIAEGHSQGGGQAIPATALSPYVTGLVLSCPTHCDHTGPLVGRPAGWPKLIEVRDGTLVREQIEACRYYDGMQFAPRIHVPASVSTAFLDSLCPPSGVYAMYNALAGPKSIRHDPTVGHIHTDAAKAEGFRWVEEQVSGRSA